MPRPLLFLDFDGVLNNHAYWRSPECKALRQDQAGHYQKWVDAGRP